MKPGRVIAADEQEARERAAKIVEDAEAEAKRLLDDANVLANKLVGDARIDAQRASAKLKHETLEVEVVAEIEAAVAAANREGRVDEVTGLVIRATVPGVALGEVVNIDRRDERRSGEKCGGDRDDEVEDAEHVPGADQTHRLARRPRIGEANDWCAQADCDVAAARD